jgi:hypothetical protein
MQRRQRALRRPAAGNGGPAGRAPDMLHGMPGCPAPGACAA